MKDLLKTACAIALTIAGAGASSARAGIEYVDQFRSQFDIQTADGPSLILGGYAFATRLYASAPNLYDTVTMTSPGLASPVDLTNDPGNPAVYSYSSPLYFNLSTMNADFPAGDYAYAATNGGGTDATSVTYSTSDYPLSTPYLTGTNYSDLQGMNAGQDFHFGFSSFDTGSTASFSYIFFTIYDNTSNSLAYDAGFLNPSTSGLTLSAGTLQAGHDYSYELIFSNRDIVPSDGTTFDSQLGFDYRTSGSFSTAVPEPSSLVLGASGLLAFALARARRRV